MPPLPNLLAHYLTILSGFIGAYWLPFAYVILLTGLFWLPERGLFSRSYYLLFAAPALLALVLRPRHLRNALGEPVIVLFVLFSVWLLATMAWAPAEQTSSMAKRPLYVFMLFGGCMLMALSSGERRLEKALHVGALALTPLVAYSLIQHVLTNPEHRLVGSGALVNPLLTSHILGLFCTYCLARWVCLRGLQPLVLVAGVTFFVAMVGTGSRTPLMGLSLAAVALTLIWHRRKALLVLGVMALGALLALTLSPDLLTQRGLSHRPEIWSKAIALISEAPWLGQGYGAELAIYVPSLQMNFSDPHNVWLAVTYQTGVIGLTLWAFMYAAAFLACARNRDNPDFAIAWAMLMYGLAAGMTEGSNFLSRPNESWFLIWIPLALVAALSIRQRLQDAIGRPVADSALDALLADAQVLEADGYGTKVAILGDGDFLKLYRRKRLVSSSLLTLPATRFARNARRLQLLGVATPEVTATFQVPGRKLNAVRYQPLPGETLRMRWAALNDAQRGVEVFEFGRFLGELHERGIYFRSLHLGNVLHLEDGRFGLIDLSDMRIQDTPLSIWKRRRNLRHMLRYPQDAHWLSQLHAQDLKAGYAARCGTRAEALFPGAANTVRETA